LIHSIGIREDAGEDADLPGEAEGEDRRSLDAMVLHHFVCSSKMRVRSRACCSLHSYRLFKGCSKLQHSKDFVFNKK
jgi:hypothetical protein